MRRVLESAALWLASFVLALIVLEATVRLKDGIALSSTDNFIYRLHDFFLLNNVNQYDPAVGWVAKANIDTPGYTTGADGIRMNENKITPLRQDGILMVGDSFSIGSEVADDQTAAAALERLSGLPVLNAGSGGYAPDQSILRARQLIDIVKPRVIVLDHTEDQLQDMMLTVYGGAHRPYYTLERGKLVHHNDPVPREGPGMKELGRARDILGHSYLLVWAALRINHENWLGARQVQLRPRQSTYTRVGCALLQQFQASAQSRGIILVWVVRYPGQHVDNLTEPQLARIAWLDRCAARAGYLVVDSFDEFHRLYEQDRATFDRQYNRFGAPPQYSHMSPEGNARIARLIFDQLKPRLAGAPTERHGASAQ